MKPVFRIGSDDFKKLQDSHGYFVDKSLLIKEIIEGNEVTLLPRPRRFGKTLNMTMLRYFFEKNAEDRAYLFENLKISTFPDCIKHQGQYPVIYLTLKQIKGETFQEAELQLRKMMSELYTYHKNAASILDTEIARRDFDEIRNGVSTVAALKSSLRDLVLILYSYHNKPAVILIDEYDNPMIDAWTHGYYSEMAEFMRAWLGGGLKHENALALYRAVVTGILRIAKESIFSDLNNLSVSSTLLPNNLSYMFGFTEEEIFQILRDFDRTGEQEVIRDWYNGYIFGEKTIYNPWSVSTFINQYPAPPAPHWLNTSANTLVYEELTRGGIEIKRDLENLLSGDVIRYPITETITFTDIGRNIANIWSFLYFSGYLCATEPRWADYDPNLLTYALSIPNREIAVAYKQFVNNLYGVGDPSSGITSFLSFFLEDKDTTVLEQTVQQLSLSLISVHDLTRLPEAVFHAFVLGLLANLNTVYDIRSHAESGYGRADILMIPKKKKYPKGYVIEFKSLGKQDDAEKSARKALIQIKTNEYDTPLIAAGVSPNLIRHIAVILQGKKVLVRE